MATQNLIATDDFCLYHHLEQTFIHELHNEGLITISVVNKKSFIPHDELHKLERMIHLHRDLDINVPGIASVTHLLQKMDNLQHELWALRNRLRRYEDE